MSFRASTLDRMDKRVVELIARIDECLDAFDEDRPFGNDMVSSHVRAIELRRKHASLWDAIEDDVLLNAIHETLAAWGMNARGATLRPVEEFRISIRRNRSQLVEFEATELGSIQGTEERVARSLWEIITDLDVGDSRSKLVGGTKTLHHLLPDLVPPMDRRYTERFFFESPGAFQRDEQAAFLTAFPRLAHLAAECAAALRARVGTGPMSTSISKCVDNAIVGYVLPHQG